jgi:hypothetical protein
MRRLEASRVMAKYEDIARGKTETSERKCESDSVPSPKGQGKSQENRF